MIKSPRSLGCIHFIGIGGIGMSALAEVLHKTNIMVSGSDLSHSANVQRLIDMGIKVTIGHHGPNVQGVDTVVISSAVKEDNPELIEARKMGVPIIRRADMLAELMRFRWAICVGGTHGKTTTTSLIAHLLVEAGLDPTIINGGIINRYATNAILGGGDWLVAEADESDGTFLKYPSTVAVVTNIDAEHLDHYGSFEQVVEAFYQFVMNVPFYGFAVLCLDHPVVQKLIARCGGRKVISYGFSAGANVRIINPQTRPDGNIFTIHRQTANGLDVGEDIFIPMFGNHNISNATATICVAREIGVAWAVIRTAMAHFSGVKRRFTTTGVVNNIRIIDDYGHHPVEIAAVLSAAKSCIANGGRIIAVMQPHRFTRLRDLMEEFCGCFTNADEIIIADVYSAGEEAIAGVDSDMLVQKIHEHGFRQARKLPHPDQLPQIIAQMAKPHDMVVCLGAGDITKWAYNLPIALEEIYNTERVSKLIFSKQ